MVPGVPRYHNAHCILIRFLGDSDLDKMTLAAAREAGWTPCRACLPDQRKQDVPINIDNFSVAKACMRRLRRVVTVGMAVQQHGGLDALYEP